MYNPKLARKGRQNGMFGVHRFADDNPFFKRKHSKRTKEKISKSRKGITANEKHPQWKGDNVSYDSLHAWIRKHKGKPKKCENCDRTKEETILHWANKDHKYSRNLDDYFCLCVKCHWKYDKKFNKKKYGVNRKKMMNFNLK